MTTSIRLPFTEQFRDLEPKLRRKDVHISNILGIPAVFLPKQEPDEIHILGLGPDDKEMRLILHISDVEIEE